MEELSVVSEVVTATVIDDLTRINTLPNVFGSNYLYCESTIYSILRSHAEEYNGAYWEFFSLSNGGFYMAPHLENPLMINVSGNHFSGELSPDAAGIFACLMAFNHYAWRTRDPRFVQLFDDLREYALSHPESDLILRAID
jgi:hypothetical protein